MKTLNIFIAIDSKLFLDCKSVNETIVGVELAGSSLNIVKEISRSLSESGELFQDILLVYI